MRRFWEDKAATAVVLSSFALSLCFNWLGVQKSIDKTALPSLLLTDPRDAQVLKDAMLKLRERLYEERYAIEESNIIMQTNLHSRRPKSQESAVLSLGDQKVSLPHALLHDMRALFLLHPYCETDSIHALRRIRLSRFDLNPHFYQYGGFFLYPLGAVLFLAGKLQFFIMTSDIGFYISNPGQVSKLYAVGEMFIGFVTSLGVFAIHQAAGLLGGRPMALLAPLFFALVPLFAVESHLLKPFSYSVPWMLWALYFIFRAQKREPCAKEYFFSGLFSGLSIGSLYLNWFLPIAIFAGHYLNPFRRKFLHKSLSAALGGLLLGFFAFNPYYLFSPTEPIREWIYLTQARPFGGVLSRVPDFFLVHIPQAMGWPLWISACAGILLSLRQRRSSEILLILCIAGFTVQTISAHGTAHYATPLLPLLVLMAARFVAAGLSDPAWRPWAQWGLSLVLGVSLLNQIFFASLFLQPDPLYSLGQWIHSKIPARSRLMFIEDCSRLIIPIRYWNYFYEYPPTRLSVHAQNIPRNAFLVQSLPADFIISGECSQGDSLESFSRFGLSYARTVSFGRSPLLKGFFQNRQIPSLDYHYTVYKRLDL